MNILVTGANGFIGLHLCNYLKTQKTITIYKIGKKNINNEINFFESDLSKKNSVNIICDNLKNKKIDVIFHLASKLVGGNQDIDEKIKVFDENIKITKNIIEITKFLKPKKIINVSSIAVYPNIDGNFKEDSQIDMSNNTDCFYGLSKFCSEIFFNSILSKLDVNVLNLRIAQVYGAGMRNDRIFSIMQEELKKNNSITVYGNGERLSNFINIDQLVIFFNIFIKTNYRGTFNVGDQNISYLKLALLIKKQFGNKSTKIIKINKGIKSKFKLNCSKLNKLNNFKI